jgi:hypothetical protein
MVRPFVKKRLTINSKRDNMDNSDCVIPPVNLRKKRRKERKERKEKEEKRNLSKKRRRHTNNDTLVKHWFPLSFYCIVLQ